jgi:DNA-binding transcriptional MocR family regulator
MVPGYRRKRDVLLTELHVYRERFGTWNVPEGGCSLWIELQSAVEPCGYSRLRATRVSWSPPVTRSSWTSHDRKLSVSASATPPKQS